MKRNVTFQLVSSTLVLSTLSLSFLPSLVRAQEIELHQSQPMSIVEEAPTVLDIDPVTDGSDNVSKKEVKQALQNIEGLLEDSQDVEVTRDADSAAIVTSDSGTTVDLPKDPSDAIVLSSDNAPAIEITLPQADESKKAKTIDDGVVAYPGRDGSANAIQATEDGSVKMLTIIDNADAPTEYAYGITVPEGGRVELTSDGGAVVLDHTDQAMAIVNTPWAMDAAGMNLVTYFTTDGVSLTQHIFHDIQGVSYPVTADPLWIPAAVMWSIAKGCVWGVIGAFGEDALRQAVERGSWYWSEKIKSYGYSCAYGAMGAGVWQFVPQSVKSFVAHHVSILVKDVARFFLR